MFISEFSSFRNARPYKIKVCKKEKRIHLSIYLFVYKFKNELL